MVLAIDRERGFSFSVFGYEDDTRRSVVSSDTVSMVTSHAGVERLRSNRRAIVDAEEVVVMVHCVSLSLSELTLPCWVGEVKPFLGDLSVYTMRSPV